MAADAAVTALAAAAEEGAASKQEGSENSRKRKRPWSSDWQGWAQVAVGLWLARAFYEATVGVLRRALRSGVQDETPRVHAQPTPLNK
jgi:hypothetical protein